MINSKAGPASLTNSLRSTLKLMKIDEKMIPFQNGIPYPSFEPQSRMVQSLEGEWKKKRFEADHDWTMTKRDDNWIAKTEQDSFGITGVEFNDSTWETHYIPLPENKLTGKEEVNGAETYENGVWYRRCVFLDENWSGKTISLKCLGLSYVGDFWINGSYVGYHEGGYTPFSFDVTSYLINGENTIVVRVDNPPWTSRIDTIPAVDNDFFNYTGIIQDIFLEATSGVHVARTDIVPQNVDGDLDITVVVENRTEQSRNISLKGNIFETDFLSEDWLSEPCAKSLCKQRLEVRGLKEMKVELAPFETKVLNYRLSIENPKLWSIREPNLYVLEVLMSEGQLEVDSFYSQFGIRTIKTNQAKICLNEESVFLAGVARHEEWPGYGRTASWDRIKSDFHQIADLSVNMVRTAHYPNHIYTFIMLDRLGLTAMSEIPLWQFETHHYEVQENRGISYQMWREMVFSHFNRPSIIMWSTQNESKDVKLRKKYNEKLVNEVRTAYNDGRLITQSAAADQPGFDDESMEPLDVAGWTMYFGIFHGSTPYEGTRDFIEKAHQKWPDKPIINTEYGIWSNADGSNLQEQVAIYNDVQLALLEKATVSPQGFINEKGFIAGIDYWTAFDWYVNHNQFYQTMGMYHMDRTTKKPLYHRFIEDHQRLMKTTNGLGKYQSPEPMITLKFKEEILSSGMVEYILEEPKNMNIFNYLTVKLMDSQSLEGINVQIADVKGNITSFQTYGIQVNRVYEVFVPLWKLSHEVIANAASIQLTYNPNRQLKVLELACMMAGR
ncbi:glycoside hydrolase family 2 TIM barrel-domain containing protein [Falsibacillus albus]|uniref:Glycoside hydrolase family 2 n=1 Tax=Falsibacillus albus TaxID=2478915 RepID=A0A3L7JT35_9BACI|nr:glycoside hydrolase family 2 TIM barrel-domain containing protein [Falsibacillus albus]RLQ94027.1 glycoside hydrolase family 2 [Falsibacillus albus]